MTNAEPWSLSVVIPARNEGSILEDSVAALAGYLEGRHAEYEIIVVDDGSRDDTCQKMERVSGRIAGLRTMSNGRQRGKGYAVRRGVLAASKAHILYCDADLSVPIEEVEKLLEELAGGCDIAIGSRMVPGAQVLNQPRYRSVMRSLLHRFVEGLLLKGIQDTQCGFKCFKREVAQELFRAQRFNGFSFEVEVLCLARRNGYRIREVPVRYVHRSGSTIRPVRDSLGLAMDLLRLRLRRQAKERGVRRRSVVWQQPRGGGSTGEVGR